MYVVQYVILSKARQMLMMCGIRHYTCCFGPKSSPKLYTSYSSIPLTSAEIGTDVFYVPKPPRMAKTYYEVTYDLKTLSYRKRIMVKTLRQHAGHTSVYIISILQAEMPSL